MTTTWGWMRRRCATIFATHLGRVGLVQFAVEIAQEFDAPDTQDLCCRSQFCLPRLSQRRYTGIILSYHAPATLTPRGGNEEGFDMLSGRFRQNAAKTQRFVIRMSQDGQ